MVTSLGRHDVSKYVLVRVETDAGIDGVGEATVMPKWSGETVWGAQAIIDNVLAPAVIGCDPTDIDEIDAKLDGVARLNWFAKAAIEMACWDIAGKDAGKPVYELLGGPARPQTFQCRFSMGAYDTDRARTLAQELLDDGFTYFKVKVGTQHDQDVARVQAVRETIGPDYKLMIDANCGFDTEAAIRCAEALADCNVCLFEQPTPCGDFAGLAEVRRRISFPVMADDICFDLSDAVNCVRADACDLISVYPGKNGGIGKSKRIVEYAAENSIACSIGSNLELDVATAAMAHLVVACPNLKVEEFPGDVLGPEYHAKSIAKNPVEIKGPNVTVPPGPGLGIDVDWDVVESHRIR